MTTKGKTPNLDQLAEHEQRVGAARAKVDETKRRARHAEAEATRLRELLTEAFASDDQAQVEKLTRAKAKADARAAEPWVERIAGAERATARVQAEVDGWRIENFRGLLDEAPPMRTSQPKRSRPQSPGSSKPAGVGTRCPDASRR